MAFIDFETTTPGNTGGFVDFDAAPPSSDGDLSRGWKRAFAQVPELAYGTGALAAMSAEKMFGEGGISTAVKDYFSEKFSAKQAVNQQYVPSVDFTDAWDSLQGGNLGAMADWLQDSAGYVAGQALQTAVTGGVGAVVGKAAITKLLGGAVANQAARLAEDMVVKQGVTAAAKDAAIKAALPEATKLAAQRTAQAIGAGVALGAQNVGMEAGDIYGGLIEQAKQTGQDITGDDLLRAWGAAAVAAGTETATDLLGLGAVTGRIKIGTKSVQSMTGLGGRAARAGVAAGVGAPIEAGQEYVQTWLEQYGAGRDPDSPEAERERINAAAVGGLGGTMVGGAAGVISSPITPAPTPSPQTTPTPQPSITPIITAPDVETAIRAADEIVSAPVQSEPIVSTEPAPLPELTTGPRTQEQQLWMAGMEAEQIRAAERAKEADYDRLQRESRLPAALYDAERADRIAQKSGQRVFEEAPTAMMLAFERARQKATTPEASTLTDKEIDLARRLTRSEEKRDAFTAEIERRTQEIPHEGQNQTGLPSQERVGQELVQAQPDLERGGRAVEAGRILQAQEQGPGAQPNAVVPVGQLFVDYQGRRYPVASLEEASRKFSQARDAAVQAGGGGASTVGKPPLIRDQSGRVIGNIAYNGRIFSGEPKDWKPGVQSLYDPPGWGQRDSALDAIAEANRRGDTEEAKRLGEQYAGVQPIEQPSTIAPAAPTLGTIAPKLGIPEREQNIGQTDKSALSGTAIPERENKIGGRLVSDIPLPMLRKFAEKGGPKVRFSAQAEIERRSENTRLQQEKAQAVEAQRNTPSAQLLRMLVEWGGVNKDSALDISGDKGVRGLGGGIVARIFRTPQRANGGKGHIVAGHGLDDIALRLVEAGWLPGHIYDESVDGGVQIVRDMIRDAIDGRLQPITDQQAERMFEAQRQARQEMDQDMRAEGVPDYRPDDAKWVDLATKVAERDPDRFERLAVQYEGRSDDEFRVAVQELFNAHQREDEAANTGGQEARGAPPSPEAAAPAAATEEVTLTGQRPADLTPAAEQARAAEVSQREERAIADRERDAFTLSAPSGTTSAQPLAEPKNQRDMFASPALARNEPIAPERPAAPNVGTAAQVPTAMEIAVEEYRKSYPGREAPDDRILLTKDGRFISFSKHDADTISGAEDLGWQRTPWPPIQRPTTVGVQAEKVDVQESAPFMESEQAGKGEQITDFGEKIGGARKDTAQPTGGRTTTTAGESGEPGWRKRFSVSQVAASTKEGEAGKWVIRDERKQDWRGQARQVGETFASQEAAEKAIPLLAVAQKHRAVPVGKPVNGIQPYEIWRDVTDRKRVKVVQQQFATREDAMRYMAEHAVEIIETKTGFGEEIIAKPDTVTRTGAERRTGLATKEMFGDTFGFRGVEFGNWNNQDERQEVMNHAYDGLLDLADVLDVPAKALSLNGELALAFGARGQGLSGAKAHYERDYGVINLTKMTGAGSLAHEWFHATDHYFARQDTKSKAERVKNEEGNLVYPAGTPLTDYASHGFRAVGSQVRPELRDAYNALMETMFTNAEQYVEDTQKAEKFVGGARERLAEAIKEIRDGLLRGPEQLTYMKRNNKPASSEQIAAFDQLADQMLAGKYPDAEFRYNKTDGGPANRRGAMAGRWSNDVLDSLSAILKAVRGRSGFSAEGHGPLDGLRYLMKTYLERIRMLESANANETKTKRVPTSYAMENKKIDQGRASDYWTTPHEMAARAFSSYVEDKVKESGNRSDFLSYGSDNRLPEYRLLNVRPFPEGAERTAINAAFDKLVSTLQTRPTDKGVAMFARGPKDAGTPVERSDTVETSPAVQDLNEKMFRQEGISNAFTSSNFNDKGLTDAYKSAFGVEIVYVSPNAAGAEQFLGIHYGGKIYVNPKNPHHGFIQLAGHELFHKIKEDYPEVYQWFADQAANYYRPGATERYGRNLEKTGAKNFDAQEELLADFTGDALADPEFLKVLANHNPSKFKQLLDTVVAWLKRVAMKLYGKGFRSSEYFTDVNKLRGYLAGILDAYAKQNSPDAIDGVEPPSFSRVVEQNAPPTQTDTPEFKAWFGDSKVVDENGKPLVVYHGTPTDFSAFNIDSPRNMMADRTAQGFYFTRDPEDAERYGVIRHRPNAGGQIMPVYLSVQNPLILSRDTTQPAIAKDMDMEHPALVSAEQRRKLEAAGYDGIVYNDGEEIVAFRPEQIKSAVGNRGTFSPTDPDIRFSRAGWINQQPVGTQEALRKAGVWFAPPTLKARVAGWSQDWQKRLKQGVVDQFDPIKEYDYHAYMIARMTRGADNALDGLLNYGTVYLDQDGAVDVNFEKGGFLGIMSKLKGEHDRFLAWVIGNRAERLLAEGREHNFTAQDIQALKALNQGSMPDGTPRAQEYAKVLSDLNRYNKAVLDIAEKAGLIDGASRSAWEKDFYVPFYRLMEGEDGKPKGPMPSKGLVNQYAFKVLKGGEQALGDPMQNILKNWAHLLDASLKNQAARESLLAAQRVGAVVEGQEDTVRQMAKAAGLKDAVVSFTDQGTQRWFMVEDAFLLDAIKGIGFTGFQGTGMKVMQKFKKWLTIGVTVSPTFRIRNVIRDSLQMIGTNPASYNVLDNVLTGWKATKEGTPEYASIMAGGGVMRFGTILDGDRAEHVKRLIASGVDDQTILTTPERVKDAMQQAWDWWQHVGDRAENVNRAALYKKLRADGKTHLEASFGARDTMDFSMLGTWASIRFLAQTVPFFSARLQGLYKLGRGAAEDPRRFGIVVGGATLASIALMLAYRDDDDWKRREDFDRETFFWLKIGDKAFRIPKPFEIGAIATIAERGLEAMISDELTGKQFAGRVFSIVSQQLSMNPVPQMAMPFIELYANRDSFTDRPIEGMGMERLSKSRRIGANTSATAQLLGKNGLVSPVQIDHLVSGYFGWLGAHIVSTADLALRPAMGLPEKPALRIDDVLVAGDFVKDLPAYQSKYVTRVYDQMKEVQQAMADLKELQKIGATEEAQKLMVDKADKLRLYRLYTHAEKQLTKINTQIKLTQAKAGDADEKRERLGSLYAIRNRIAQLTEERARSSQR